MHELAQAATQYEIALTGEELSKFARYESLLLEWNRRMNLTAIDEPAEIRVRHFLDALTCATVTGDLDGKRLIDVGTGAGFPGLPLKILYPGLELTLVDSVTKKTRFLEAVVGELGLSGVTICDKRAEVLAHEAMHREKYDWALARAVAELRILLEYLLPFCRVGGRVLAQKGANAQDEVAEARHAIEVLGGAAPAIFPVRLPERGIDHHLVLIQKVNPTPEAYPRRTGRPAKRPL